MDGFMLLRLQGAVLTLEFWSSFRLHLCWQHFFFQLHKDDIPQVCWEASARLGAIPIY